MTYQKGEEASVFKTIKNWPEKAYKKLCRENVQND